FTIDQINIDVIHNMFNIIESKIDSKKSNNSIIIAINAECYSSLVDKTTGNITHIFYNPDGTIVYQYETTFFENLDNADDSHHVQHYKSLQSPLNSQLPPFSLLHA